MNQTELYKIVAGLDEKLVERADNAREAAETRPEAASAERRSVNGNRSINSKHLSLTAALAIVLVFTMTASLVAAELSRNGSFVPGTSKTPVTIEYSTAPVSGKAIRGPEGYFLELEFPAVIENNEQNAFEFTFLAGFDEVIYAEYWELLCRLPEDEQPNLVLTFDSLDNHAYDTSEDEASGVDRGFSVHCELEPFNLVTHANDTVSFSGETAHNVTFPLSHLDETFGFYPGTEWTDQRIALPYSLNVSAMLPGLAEGDCGWITAWLHEDGIEALSLYDNNLASAEGKQYYRVNHLVEIFYYCTGDYIGFGPNIYKAYANATHYVEWHDPYTVVDETTLTYRSDYHFRDDPAMLSHAPAPTVDGVTTPEPTEAPVATFAP